MTSDANIADSPIMPNSLSLEVVVPTGAWFTSNRFPRNVHHHTAMKEQLRWLAKAAYAAAGRPVVPAGLVHVLWTIGYPTAAEADASNSQPVCKALLDQYVREGLLGGDSNLHLRRESWEHSDRRAPKGTHTVRLTIYPLT